MVEIIHCPGLLRVDFCPSYRMPILEEITGASAWDIGHPSSHSSMEKNVLLHKEVPLVHYNLEIIRAMLSKSQRCIWKSKRVELSIPTKILQSLFLCNLSSICAHRTCWLVMGVERGDQKWKYCKGVFRIQGKNSPRGWYQPTLVGFHHVEWNVRDQTVMLAPWEAFCS